MSQTDTAINQYISHTCISVAFPRRPFPPSWSSHCQSTPRTTLAPGKIPRDVIFLLFRRGSTNTLFYKQNKTKHTFTFKQSLSFVSFNTINM